MKKCPTCEKTFEDSMRFCQVDGTPLVDAAPPVDPYKTMVAQPGEIAAAIPPPPIERPNQDDDVLQLPRQNDPLKTMFASEDEIRREMAGEKQDEQVIEIPPLVESPRPEAPPRFSPPAPPPMAPPSPFGTSEPPPSPFASSEPTREPSWSDSKIPSPPSEEGGFGNRTTYPIPSPFGENSPSRQEISPEPPPFREPEPKIEPAFNPFDQPPAAATPQWTPPPVPQAVVPERGGSGMALPPSNPAASGPNQTLAIVSLVLGIISILICQITGPVAVVLGFMARGKANKNPREYGGGGLAVGGIITGLIGTLLLFLAVIYLIFVFGFVATQNF